MGKIKDISNIALSKVYRLELREDINKGFVRWGKKNDFNSYLVGLADNQAEHGAILNVKSKYLSGVGLDSENEILQKFLQVANPNESWYELKKKLDKDQIMYGAIALKVVPNLLGEPLFYYHIPYGNLRVSKDSKVYTYSDNWQGNEYEYPRTKYLEYKEGSKKVGLIVVKDYFTTDNLFKSLYGRPSYHAALVDIDTYVRVSTYYNTLVQSNFNKSAIITIYDDNPTVEKKATIAKGLMMEQGEEADKGVIVNWSRNGQKAAEITELSGNNLDKQYESVTQTIKEKIIIAHEINPILAGLSVDGKLGVSNSNEIKQAHELYIKKWAIPTQQSTLRLIEKLCGIKNKLNFKGLLFIKQLDWVGDDLSINDNLINTALNRDEIRAMLNKRYNLELEDLSQKTITTSASESINALSPLVANKVLESMSKDEIRGLVGLKSETINMPTPQQELSSGNEFMSKLSRRQIANMMRLVDDYEQGKKTLAQTLILIKAFGLNDEQAKEFIAIETTENDDISKVQQSKESCCEIHLNQDTSKDTILIKLINEYAHEVNEDDEIIELREVGLNEISISGQVRLASQQQLTLNQLRNAILNQFKGNPEVDINDISNLYNVDVNIIQEQLEWLVEKKLLQSNANGFEVSEKAINKKTNTPSEIYTEYYYDLREGVSGQVILPTTRAFCKEMYKLHSENKKALTLKQIERIKNEFGDDAFVYSGGFWNNGKFTDVKCRHAWIGRTKIKKG